jgi:hypothetical protein
MKTETQKIRDSITLTDREIIRQAHKLDLPYTVDCAGAPVMGYESWVLLATSVAADSKIRKI